MTRIDHYENLDALRPNRLIPSASAVVVAEQGDTSRLAEG